MTKTYSIINYYHLVASVDDIASLVAEEVLDTEYNKLALDLYT
jgi:hypothetical protein